MESAGFVAAGGDRIGTWVGPDDVPIDLMVPDIQGGPGKRGARLGPHGNTVARKAKGREAALVDHAPMTISALDPSDDRQISVAVAGPTALLVAKLHKLYERRDAPNRLNDKDALDVYRLLQAIPTETYAELIPVLLDDERSQEVTRLALSYLGELFGTSDAQGSLMAGRAAEPLHDPAEIAASCTFLTEDLLAVILTDGSDAR